MMEYRNVFRRSKIISCSFNTVKRIKRLESSEGSP